MIKFMYFIFQIGMLSQWFFKKLDLLECDDVLELDSGDGCRTMWMWLILLSFILKTG